MVGQYAVSLVAALIAGFVFAIVVEAARFRPPPGYIRFISSSYVLLQATVATAVWFNGAAWIVAPALAGEALGLVAMANMWRHYQPHRRRTRHERRTFEAAVTLLEQMPEPQRERLLQDLRATADYPPSGG